MLLPPGCRFRVEGLMDAGNDLTIIQLLELPSKEWIVDLSPGEASSKALLSAAKQSGSGSLGPVPAGAPPIPTGGGGGAPSVSAIRAKSFRVYVHI